MARIDGSNFSDTLYGTGGRDSLFGYGGNDFLYESPSADKFHGGAGFDTYFLYLRSPEAWSHGGVVNLGKGKGVDPSGARATLDGIEEVVATAGADKLIGSSRDDWFSPLAGDDVIKGKGGIDSVYYWAGDAPAQGAYVDLRKKMGVDNFGFVDKLKGIEDIQVSWTDDVVKGDGKTNFFHDRGGDDLFNGRGGYDVVMYDRGKYAYDGVAVKVKLDKGWSIDSDGDRDRLKNIEDVRGSAFDDRLVGDRGDNILEGWSGADKLTGKGGADEFRFMQVTDSSRLDGVDLITDFQAGTDVIGLGYGIASLDSLEIIHEGRMAVVRDGAFLLHVKGDVADLSIEDFILV